MKKWFEYAENRVQLKQEGWNNYEEKEQIIDNFHALND